MENGARWNMCGCKSARLARFNVFHKPGTLRKEQLSSFQRVKCIATSREVEKEKGFHSYPAEQ